MSDGEPLDEIAFLHDRLTRGFDQVEFIESVPVRERFKAESFWQLEVHVFRVEQGREALRMYAFLHPVRGPSARQVHLIPQSAKTPDPSAAVREAISRQVGAST